MAKIRKRYNQVPHLTQDTTWESNNNTINITNKSQEASLFPAGDHKTEMNRRQSITNTRHKNTNDPQKKYRLGMRFYLVEAHFSKNGEKSYDL